MIKFQRSTEYWRNELLDVIDEIEEAHGEHSYDYYEDYVDHLKQKTLKYFTDLGGDYEMFSQPGGPLYKNESPEEIELYEKALLKAIEETKAWMLKDEKKSLI